MAVKSPFGIFLVEREFIDWSEAMPDLCGRTLLSIQLRSEIERKFRNKEFTCEKELTMSIISGKYKVVIIWHLGNEGPHRYSELFKLFKGISNRILTKQLRDLEQDGILSRHVYPVAPPRVEYFLTDMGKTLLPIVNAIWHWGKENMRYYYEKFLDKNTPALNKVPD